MGAIISVMAPHGSWLRKINSSEAIVKRLLLLAALVSLALVSCSVKPSVIITDQEAQKGRDIAKGTVFAVQLTAKMSTGFSWEIVSMGKGLEAVGRPDVITPKQNRTGMDEIMLFKFRAIETGKYEINFRYKRPWEKKEPEKIFSMEVNVVSSPE